MTPPLFVGRTQILRHLELALDDGRSVSIVGDWRIGKSSLLQTWRAAAQERGRMVRLLSGEGPEAASLSKFVRAVTGSPTAEEPEAAADALKEWARETGLPGLPPLILVDEVESMLTGLPHRFFERLRGMLGDLCLVLSSRRELDRVYRELGRTSPFHNRLQLHWLGLLEPAAAEQLVALGGPGQDAGEGDLIHCWAGRHPYFLQLLGWHLVQAHQEGLTANDALDAFRTEANARLRELWGTLTERERGEVMGCLSGSQCSVLGLRNRGLVTQEGRLFGEVLAAWLRDQILASP